MGLFLLLHLWTNAKALQGQQAFDEAMAEIDGLPYLLLIEIFGIALPLLFHAIWGLVIILGARPNVRRYPTSRNWMYTLQRLSGIVTLAFIAYHLWQFRLPVALGPMDKADYFPELCSSLSSTVGPGIPLVALVYLVGIAASVLHFTNGLYGFCFSWGITLSRRATRLASGAFGLLGIAVFVLGASTVIYFATGSRLTLSTRLRVSGPPALSCRDLGRSSDKAAALDPKETSEATSPGSAGR